MVKYLLTSQSTERTVPVYELISFTRSVQNRTMATISDLWTEWMVSTSFRARRVLVLNFLENRRRSPARAMVNVANRQSLTTGGGGGGDRFDTWPVHVRYVVVKVAMSQVSLRVLRFSPACSIPPIHQTHLQLHGTHTRRTMGLHSKVLWFHFFTFLI